METRLEMLEALIEDVKESIQILEHALDYTDMEDKDDFLPYRKKKFLLKLLEDELKKINDNNYDSTSRSL